MLKVTIAHDSGTSINPLSIRGQIEGQAVMSQGDMFLEEILFEGGQIVNPSFIDYALPESMGSTEVNFIDVLTFEPTGPFGAKEAGECARPPLMAAIANAIYHATGIRFNTLPITADRILVALKKQ